jgi:hypothetical protein
VFCSLVRVTGCDGRSRCPSSCAPTASRFQPPVTGWTRGVCVLQVHVPYALHLELVRVYPSFSSSLIHGPRFALAQHLRFGVLRPRSRRHHARWCASPGTAPWPRCSRCPCLAASAACVLSPPSAFLANLFFSALLPAEGPHHCRSGCWKLDTSVPPSLPWIGPRPLLDSPMPALFSISCVV